MTNSASNKSVSSLTLALSGVGCASCIAKIENALASVDGVKTAAVNLAAKTVLIESDQPRPNPAPMIAAVEKAGYGATLLKKDEPAEGPSVEEELSHLKSQTLLAAILTLPVFILEMGSHLYQPFHHWVMASLGQSMSWGVQFLLTTLLLLGPGRRFFTHGLKALFQRSPSMDSLVALGSGSAYVYSLVATFLPGVLPQGTAQVYYESAALIITLILVGRYFEEKAKGRTGEAIAKLMDLNPKTARVERNGEFVEVPLASVVVEDRIQVRPGETVPVDGKVESGSSFVNEAMITGESVPVEKSEGATVIGGTLNQKGSFIFRATGVGEDTMLSRIIDLVGRAQSSKLPLQTAVNQVTAWFVPAVLIIALFTFFVWFQFGPQPALNHALVAAVSVLIVACPCAMGLATPTSIMVGVGRGAESGLLFRGGEALQTLKNSRVVAFDKTGTLTRGQPALTDFQLLHPAEQDTVLRQIASLESGSEHPIAQALVDGAEERGLKVVPPQEFESLTGLGVQGKVDGVTIRVGSASWMRTLGHSLDKSLNDFNTLASSGKSALYAEIDGQLAALVAVADPLKDSTRAAVKQLQESGFKVAMLTGDNTETAQAIARQCGIDEVKAELSPEGKVKAIEELQRQFGQVAFVGDGINDAPALATAEVGLAIGSGTDIAIESADIVVLSQDLTAVARAAALSKATLKNIWQNLFWAFAYNVVLIPVAAGALYPTAGILLSPALAAGAMAFSSVFVLLNALRLKGVKL